MRDLSPKEEIHIKGPYSLWIHKDIENKNIEHCSIVEKNMGNYHVFSLGSFNPKNKNKIIRKFKKIYNLFYDKE